MSNTLMEIVVHAKHMYVMAVHQYIGSVAFGRGRERERENDSTEMR